MSLAVTKETLGFLLMVFTLFHLRDLYIRVVL